MKYWKYWLHIWKKETVLCIAVLLAAFSMPLIHPDSKYSGYMDYRTLALLFSLMTIMEGFKQTGFFADVARALLGRAHTFRQLYLVLVMLCFFCSMWITNDVALLTFVPFYNSGAWAFWSSERDDSRHCDADNCSQSGQHDDTGGKSAELISVLGFRYGNRWIFFCYGTVIGTVLSADPRCLYIS